MKNTILLILASVIVFGPSVHASDVNGNGREEILVPLAFSPSQTMNGAYGTVWTGEVWVENSSSRRILLAEAPICNVGCATFLNGAYSGLVPIQMGRPELGMIFIPPADIADQLTFSARIYETTRLGQPRGVDIPVVREHEFFRKPATFLGVPVRDGVRVTLRVYDPRVWDFGRNPFGPPVTFGVSVFDEDAKLIGTTVMAARVQDIGDGFGTSRPASDILGDLTTIFPAIAAHNRVKIVVTPEKPDTEFWALVSVTDNESQTVSLITAQ